MAAALIAESVTYDQRCSACESNAVHSRSGLVARSGTGRAVATLCPRDQGPGGSLSGSERLAVLNAPGGNPRLARRRDGGCTPDGRLTGGPPVQSTPLPPLPSGLYGRQLHPEPNKTGVRLWT
jgi:hypothetical protein